MASTEIFRILLSRLLDPFVIIVLATFLISGYSAIKYRFRRISNNLIFIATLVCYSLSLPFLSAAVVDNWEKDIKKFAGTEVNIDYILVLGCGHLEDEKLPLSNHLSTCSLRRLVEGIFVQKSLGNTPMIFTGGKGWNTKAHANVMGDVARELGVRPDLIIELDTGHTTLQEADAIGTFITNKNIVLVTSASHMKRATEVMMQKKPKNIVSAPTSFYGVKPNPVFILNFIPNLHNLSIVSKFFHEQVGRLYSLIMK